MMKPCDICGKTGHPWFDCPQRKTKPDGWKPDRISGGSRGSAALESGAGSSPVVTQGRDLGPSTKLSGGSSAVEQAPSKRDVEGSTPSPRSKKGPTQRDREVKERAGRKGSTAARKDVRSSPTVALTGEAVGAGTQAPPVDTIPGAIFVAYVPDGTHLHTYGNHVIAAGPNLPASIVTKGGLVPITSPESQLKKGGRPRTVEDRRVYKAEKARAYRAKAKSST